MSDRNQEGLNKEVILYLPCVSDLGIHTVGGSTEEASM